MRGSKREMIILDEDESGIVPGFLQDGFGKSLVHAAIGGPMIGIEDRTSEGDVTERPQTLVREAGVVSFFFSLGQPNAPKRVLGSIRRNLDVIEVIDSLAVSVAAAVSDPEAAAGAHHGIERAGHAAGGLNAFDTATCTPMLKGFAVGDNYDSDSRRALFERTR